MNPYHKGALLLLRLVAAGMILIGSLNAGLEIVRARAGKGDESGGAGKSLSEDREIVRERAGKGDASVWRGALHGALGLAGVVLLVRSSAIARRLTGDFDE